MDTIVYVDLPLAPPGSELHTALEKYLSDLRGFINKARDAEAIQLPPLLASLVEQRRPPEAEELEEVLACVSQWTDAMTAALAADTSAPHSEDTALGIIEAWQARAHALGLLVEELGKGEVGVLLELLLEAGHKPAATAHEKFSAAFKRLLAAHAEAAENVKFMSTLDKQLRALQSGGFDALEKAIPPLLHGLKLVYTISRQFKSDDKISRLLTVLANEVCDRVEGLLGVGRVFARVESAAGEEALAAVQAELRGGQAALRCWKHSFDTVKALLEKEDDIDRWDFDPKPIRHRCIYIDATLQTFCEVIEEVRKFALIIDKKLPAVVGSTKKVEELREGIRGLSRLFAAPRVNFYDKGQKPALEKVLVDYEKAKRKIQERMIALIETTFSELRSSVTAFELLQQFVALKSFEKIQEQLKRRYSTVLEKYQTELDDARRLFARDAARRPVGRGQPPVAAAITWKRALFARIKDPIMRFIRFADEWAPEELQAAKDRYRALAVELDEFERAQIERWRAEAAEKVVGFLRNKLVIAHRGQFRVAFDEEFKTLIAEAKALDKMGVALPPSVLNVALQEREYHEVAERLGELLHDYAAALGGLDRHEKALFSGELAALERALEPAVRALGLNSHGIREFIAGYAERLRRFKDLKAKYDEKKRLLDELVGNIGRAQLVALAHFEPRAELPTLAQFYAGVEAGIGAAVALLAQDYAKLGESVLVQVELLVHKTMSRSSPPMSSFYALTERQVYNALVAMVLRGLITLRTLLSPPGSRPRPLFKISTEFHSMKVVTVPAQNEIRVTLTNLVRLIKEAAGRFARWRPGSCLPFEGAPEDNAEERAALSFLADVGANPVVRLMNIEISELIKLAFVRVERYKSVWEDNLGDFPDPYASLKKLLWNQKHKFKIEKVLEKNPSTRNFEFFLDYFGGYRREFDAAETEVSAGFIAVDFSNVVRTYAQKCDEAVQRMLAALQKIAGKHAEEIRAAVRGFRAQVDEGPERDLKAYLHALLHVRNSRVDVEFQLAELAERLDLLAAHGGAAGGDAPLEALAGEWEQLMAAVEAANAGLRQRKAEVAVQVRASAEALRGQMLQLVREYREGGPGAGEVDLDRGLQLHTDFAGRVRALNAARSELTAAEKLFDVEVSAFPQLAEVEADLQRLADAYGFYHRMQRGVAEFGKQPWAKLDMIALDQFEKAVAAGLDGFEESSPAVHARLRREVDQLGRVLPLLKRLKATPAFKDAHWERLTAQIGAPPPPRQLLFEQVLALRLAEHAEAVEEALSAAAEEAGAEEAVRAVELCWKATCLEVVDYRKNNEKKGLVVRVSEEISAALNDHLVNLQNLEGSKHAAALRPAIREWLAHLAAMQETLEAWLEVQRKWMYLEGIFMGNEDIRQQLPRETKAFEAHHRAFRKINEQAARNPSVFMNCVQIDANPAQLRQLSASLDRSQKSLTDYLTAKKMRFPRFYFLSDEDLLSVLGSAEPAAVAAHLMKIFDNVKALELEGERTARGVYSEQDEHCALREPVRLEGSPEAWLQALDAQLQAALARSVKEAIFLAPQTEPQAWLHRTLGQSALAADKVWWTWHVEEAFRKIREGNKHALKQQLARQNADLERLIAMVRGDLEARDARGRLRRKVNTMIIVCVHQRDIVERFVRDSIVSAQEFEWESQLRFYFVQKADDLSIQQCTGRFKYGYEYQGLNGRLVITPLTDRCVMTLTTALTFRLGGAPAGPAGTGKTETVKDLAKAIGRRCVVTNCGENFDSHALGTNFSGLCQTGFWGCFDEFNRITPDVLSVVSSQVRAIQSSLARAKRTVTLLGAEVPVLPALGIFITMNPGYEGRSELPDNLKSLFRPVVMIVPDNQIICENMLMSEGFVSARPMAKKMTVLYKLASEQLSRQNHYDFGLRPLKAVLVAAGALKRADPAAPEEQLVMRALREMNVPKFVGEDVELFLGLLRDLFPGLAPPAGGNAELRARIAAAAAGAGLEVLEAQLDKAVQFSETLATRHAVMVIGQAGTGKSAVIDVTARSLPHSVAVMRLNPKAQPLRELYGELDAQTRDWSDGVLSKLFKQANEEPGEGGRREERRWLLFDGDVDAIWIENMNSVMDDSKLLTLSNGDRVRLRDHCKLLFEVGHTRYASPATISRCGIVYLDQRALAPAAVFRRWLRRFTETAAESEERVADLLQGLFDKYAPALLELTCPADRPAPLLVDRAPVALVAQLCALFDCQLPPGAPAPDATALESLFLFALVWSLGAVLAAAEREQFEKLVRDCAAVPLPSASLFDVYFDLGERAFLGWASKTREFAPSPAAPFHRLLVSTPDSARAAHLTALFLGRGLPLLCVGESGAGKTASVQAHLAALDAERAAVLTFNFSSRTSSLDLQRALEANCDKRRPGLYGPRGGRSLVVFLDDLHMPLKDRFETQQPLALLRLLMEHGFMFERGGALERRAFKDLLFVAAGQAPASGANALDPRLLRLFAAVGVPAPDEAGAVRIFAAILRGHLADFPAEPRELAEALAAATARLCQQVAARLTRTPLKFHYVFNLRDVARVVQGLLRAQQPQFAAAGALVRLWRHECERVFTDRLVEPADARAVEELLPALLAEHFPQHRAAAPGLFAQLAPAALPVAQRALEETSLDDARERLGEALLAYNAQNPGSEMALVLFREFIEHTLRAVRTLGLSRGHCLLVGVGGSGKQSVARLAAFVAQMALLAVSPKRNYREQAFKEDLGQLLARFTEEGSCVFLLTDNEILEEGFLEHVNALLTTGPPLSLFDEEARSRIRAAVREQCRRAGGGEGPEEGWEFFCERVRAQLHIVLCASPAGEALRQRCRAYPGLVSAMALDWFSTWPAEALREVALVSLRQWPCEAEKPAVVGALVHAHTDLPAQAARYLQRSGRVVHFTPLHFLDLLRTFEAVHTARGRESALAIRKFESGLEKLQEAARSVAELRGVIAAEKQRVETEKGDVERLLVEIARKSRAAGEKAASATEKSAQLAVENAELEQGRAETDAVLREKLPALELARLKVSEIKKADLDYIRAMNNPAKTIVSTVACLQILRVNANANEADGWAGAKLMLYDQNLTGALIDYSKDLGKIARVTPKQVKALDERLKAINDDLRERGKAIEQVSAACAVLLFWVDAVKMLYDANLVVRPLREKVERLAAEKERKEAELLETRELLAVLSAELAELNARRAAKEAVLGELAARVAAMEAKLHKAERLLTDLELERGRWAVDRAALEAQTPFIVGEAVLGALFLTYCGPFDEDFRAELQRRFAAETAARGLPLAAGCQAAALLSDEVEVAAWNSQGLPRDPLSVENGILATRGRRYPLCVDPQLQALTWLRQREAQVEAVSVTDEAAFAKTVEVCARFGKPLLVENVAETLDPLLEPLLQMNYVLRGGRKYLRLGGEEIDFKEKDFRLFLLTRLPSPRFSPEVMGKTTVINFCVTFLGLREQLLTEVISFAAEAQELQRKRLILALAESKTELRALENALLTNLVNAKGSLLENDELLETLDSSKRKAKGIAEAIAQNNATRAALEEARQSYVEVAVRGAVLFFCMQKLTTLSPMYQYSLRSYVEVFRTALREAKPDNMLLTRVENMIERLTGNTYDHVLLGLFERDRLMFSFEMTCMILEQRNALSAPEFEFLLRGNTALEAAPAEPDWLPAPARRELQGLGRLGADWGELVEAMQAGRAEWADWLGGDAPEAAVPPAPLAALNRFQVVLLMKVLRPDRALQAVKRFITEQFGDRPTFIVSPPINLRRVFAQSSARTPVAFVLSPGTDPMADLQELAGELGFTGNKFRSLALGQNMEREAEELIVSSAQRGHWVMIQNCDLLPAWLRDLERLLDAQLRSDRCHADFRLWLTTRPTPDFPFSLLQRSLKVVTEPPEGVGANLRNVAMKLTDAALQETPHAAFRPLLYVVLFFHAVLQDRKKFGKVGFNVAYDFNESDFRISASLLRLYLHKAFVNRDDAVPWASLKYLIAEAMYGGRVTDQFDRRVLVTYMDEFMGDFLFDAKNGFAFARAPGLDYALPAFAGVEELLARARELPLSDPPAVFGLHQNSQITYLSAAARYLFEHTLAMRLTGSAQAQTLANSAARLLPLLDEIAGKLPAKYDVPAVKRAFGSLDPLAIVLFQELERVNVLIEEVGRSGAELRRALRGEIAVSPDIERTAQALLNGFLPPNWRALCPQTRKGLGPWLAQLRERFAQYDRWVEHRALPACWLAGLHVPEAYLTAVVQCTARAKGWALDRTSLFTSVTQFTAPEQLPPPAPGVFYVFGLYLEGAGWDVAAGALAEQRLGELVTLLPVVAVTPVESTKLRLKDTLKVPVYVTQDRRNAAGVGHVFDADLRTQRHESHWILQGVAVILNTDT